ncbi:MAG: LLM class flavin-dependent oxidoreductase [Alphaproteobacteria bacterium]|nr:LLM class flavin-dependent oxidoreductase [Alphaproteobacteria bacterium]
MKLGMFMMPVNDHRRETHDVLMEDVEIAVRADALGFDEFWIGEHYTTLSEPVSCPFIFLANLIARTKRVRLGTGVVNLPQRHPVQTAAHAALLDHLSEGRLILGVSPGGLASDFEAFGLTDPFVRREMAVEAIDIVLKLWRAEAPFEIRGKYWSVTLKEHVYPEIGVGKVLRPYQLPHPPIVASAMSPNSATTRGAGARGWGIISANFVPVENVKTHWQGFVEGCRQVGRTPFGTDWRVARTIFVGDDDDEAKAYVRDAQGPFAHYFGYLVTLVKGAGFHAILKSDPAMPDDELTPDFACRTMVMAGSPASVAAQIVKLRREIGPFGTILMTATDLLNEHHKARLMHSMELMANDVMPRLNATLARETDAAQ